MSNSIVIMCPPLSDYPLAPADQPGCQVFDCPECKEKMWISEKKRGMLLFHSMLGNNIILRCYNCLKKMAEEGYFKGDEFKKVNI